MGALSGLFSDVIQEQLKTTRSVILKSPFWPEQTNMDMLPVTVLQLMLNFYLGHGRTIQQIEISAMGNLVPHHHKSDRTEPLIGENCQPDQINLPQMPALLSTWYSSLDLCWNHFHNNPILILTQPITEMLWCWATSLWLCSFCPLN